MKVTEAQAQEKWCPMSRIIKTMEPHTGGPENFTSYNRCKKDHLLIFEGTQCMGTGCMLFEEVEPGLYQCGLTAVDMQQ